MDTEYEEGYDMGYAEGCLYGNVRFYIMAVKAGRTDILRDIQGLPEEYIREIVAIVEKYPRYSKSHLEKRIIYECTYLPYEKLTKEKEY